MQNDSPRFPPVKRIDELTKEDIGKRSTKRAALVGPKKIADSAKCPKPVWITCFFDGTGNNFGKDGAGSTNPADTKYSNIAKLWRFAHPREDADNGIYGLYAPGVGTPFPQISDSGDGVDKSLGMASARKGQGRISWMLDELTDRVNRHMPLVSVINVAVFGFSRGAAQARAFVRQLIEKCNEKDGALFWNSRSVKPQLNIYFLGILDTVASVGYGGSRLEKALPYIAWGPVIGYYVDQTHNGGGHADWASDLRIPKHVQACSHYLAAHEVREKFPADSVRNDQEIPVNCEEIFYPGAHSDVGGGYLDMEQEGRTNELSRIPLCALYVAGYRNGVPFHEPKVVLQNAGTLFDISKELQECYETYGRIISSAATGSRLEDCVISHMSSYYQWRWGRTVRQRAALAERKKLISQGKAVMYATPEEYMTITDREWEEDVQDIAEKRTGMFVRGTTTLEDIIFDAWKGTLRSRLSDTDRKKFDMFFDRYVHDSIAGFKSQMADGGVGIAERSRWSRNRQYFLGKRGDRFLYWRFEGNRPERQPARLAYLESEQERSNRLPSQHPGSSGSEGRETA